MPRTTVYLNSWLKLIFAFNFKNQILSQFYSSKRKWISQISSFHKCEISHFNFIYKYYYCNVALFKTELHSLTFNQSFLFCIIEMRFILSRFLYWNTSNLKCNFTSNCQMSTFLGNKMPIKMNLLKCNTNRCFLKLFFPVSFLFHILYWAFWQEYSLPKYVIIKNFKLIQILDVTSIFFTRI